MTDNDAVGSTFIDVFAADVEHRPFSDGFIGAACDDVCADHGDLSDVVRVAPVGIASRQWPVFGGYCREDGQERSDSDLQGLISVTSAKVNGDEIHWR